VGISSDVARAMTAAPEDFLPSVTSIAVGAVDTVGKSLKEEFGELNAATAEAAAWGTTASESWAQAIRATVATTNIITIIGILDRNGIGWDLLFNSSDDHQSPFTGQRISQVRTKMNQRSIKKTVHKPVALGWPGD